MPDNPLRSLLRRRLANGEPLELDGYMALCLQHETHGYYRARNPFARGDADGAGDFTTAPETSQVLGELAGLWLADAWEKQGRPSPFVLAELGPGRGLLLSDAWRATAGTAGFHEAARVVFVESNEPLAAACAARLAATNPPCAAKRLLSAGDLPEGPLFLLANEFLDALPVRQYVATRDGWRERAVTLAGTPDAGDPPDPPDGDDDALRLAFCLTAPRALPPALLGADGHTLPAGFVREVAPAALQLAAFVADQTARSGGAALFVDYGYLEPPGRSTLSAVRAGQRANPLDAPGAQDLSAFVDFGAVAQAMREASVRAGRALRPDVFMLGEFLSALGLEERAARLDGGIGGDAARRALHLADAREGFGEFRALTL